MQNSTLGCEEVFKIKQQGKGFRMSQGRGMKMAEIILFSLFITFFDGGRALCALCDSRKDEKRVEDSFDNEIEPWLMERENASSLFKTPDARSR